MFKKLQAALRVLRTGEEVADPAKWKRRQITSAALTAFLSAIVAAAASFGFDIPLGDVQLEAVAFGILSIYAAVEAVITAATSKRAGLLPPSDSVRVQGEAERDR